MRDGPGRVLQQPIRDFDFDDEESQAEDARGEEGGVSVICASTGRS
jgi:hypothetical protein